MERRPQFEYSGQDSTEILSHLGTHSNFSILYALQWALQAKARALGGEDKLSEEERLLLAVLALEREVNNGGYKQFFWNRSRRFTPTILAQLSRIGCEKTAALTERAIAALELNQITVDAITAEIQRENPARDAMLNACDKEFYCFNETTAQLTAFVVSEQARIQAPRTDDYPRRAATPQQSPGDALFQNLFLKSVLSRGKWKPGIDEALQAARELAREKQLAVTERDIEAAATLLAFQSALDRKDLPSAGTLAPRALEFMGENGLHTVAHQKWVRELLVAGRKQDADQGLLAYLESLVGVPADRAANRILYAARLLSEHRDEMPQSTQFFAQRFPGVDLDKLPAPRVVAPAKELYARSEPPELH